MSPTPGASPVKEVQWQGQSAIVKVAGDIDMSRAAAFQQDLLAVLDKRPKVVVVELSEVPYMDSSGVASLVKMLARAKRANCLLRLAALNDKVRSIFEITRLDGVFEIFGTTEEALG